MKPEVGQWYRFTNGDIFEVVAVDEDDGTMEIQYYDGQVEELDIEDDWDSIVADREVEKTAAPSDWQGAFEPADPETDLDHLEEADEE